jgi:uncharacterized membrane protein YvbJ
MMFCPRCGQQQLLASARFCPSCGFALVKIKEYLDQSVTPLAPSNGTSNANAVDQITFDVPTPIEKMEKAMILATLTKVWREQDTRGPLARYQPENVA